MSLSDWFGRPDKQGGKGRQEMSTRELIEIVYREQETAKLKQQRDDLLAALRMTLREWYPRVDGCAKPDCGLCARRKKEMKQVEAVIAKAERT